VIERIKFTFQIIKSLSSTIRKEEGAGAIRGGGNQAMPGGGKIRGVERGDGIQIGMGWTKGKEQGFQGGERNISHEERRFAGGKVKTKKEKASSEKKKKRTKNALGVPGQ